MKKVALYLLVIFSVFSGISAYADKSVYVLPADEKYLKALHNAQLRIVRDGDKLSEDERYKLAKIIKDNSDKLDKKISKIKKFPYRGQHRDMHYIIYRIHQRKLKKYGKMTPVQILQAIQKEQLAQFQKAAAVDAKRKKADDAKRRKAAAQKRTSSKKAAPKKAKK